MISRIVGATLRGVTIAAVPLAALAISAVSAAAQGSGARELFDWRGHVDQEIRIEMQGGRASTLAVGPREMTGYDNARPISRVPSMNGYVSVQMREGRGIADVVQQPSARNGYTTIVRIRDQQSGAGQYDVAAFWQPANGNYGYGNYGYGNYGYGNYGYGNSGAYDQSGQYGQYGQYGDDGNDDNYGNNGGNYGGNYGGYGYPSQVIVQQPVYRRPVYRQPVYTNGGKSLPSGDRGTVYRQPDSYPGNRGDATYNQYPKGSARSGKTLPGENQSGQRYDTKDRQRTTQQGQNRQAGKSLPGATNASQQNDSWHRNH